MNVLPEGKGGRERRCKSQADTIACPGQASIGEMRFFCRPAAAEMAEGCTPCSGLPDLVEDATAQIG